MCALALVSPAQSNTFIFIYLRPCAAPRARHINHTTHRLIYFLPSIKSTCVHARALLVSRLCGAGHVPGTQVTPYFIHDSTHTAYTSAHRSHVDGKMLMLVFHNINGECFFCCSALPSCQYKNNVPTWVTRTRVYTFGNRFSLKRVRRIAHTRILKIYDFNRAKSCVAVLLRHVCDDETINHCVRLRIVDRYRVCAKPINSNEIYSDTRARLCHIICNLVRGA